MQSSSTPSDIVCYNFIADSLCSASTTVNPGPSSSLPGGIDQSLIGTSSNDFNTKPIHGPLLTSNPSPISFLKAPVLDGYGAGQQHMEGLIRSRQSQRHYLHQHGAKTSVSSSQWLRGQHLPLQSSEIHTYYYSGYSYYYWVLPRRCTSTCISYSFIICSY